MACAEAVGSLHPSRRNLTDEELPEVKGVAISITPDFSKPVSPHDLGREQGGKL
jgi:hypothetical protein